MAADKQEELRSGLPTIGIEQKNFDGSWAILALHSEEGGSFSHLDISPELRPHVVEEALPVQPGDPVRAFKGANDAIGHLIIRFDSVAETRRIVEHTADYVKVKLL